MATFFDERLYRTKSMEFEKMMINWAKIIESFEGLYYVLEHFEKMYVMPQKMGELITQALKMRSEEMRAEKKLETPTEGMYDLMRKIYGGLIYHGVDDETVEQIFMRGRPDALNTPPAQVEMMLKRIKAAFDNVLKYHQIAAEKGQELNRLLEEWKELVETEQLAERAARKARSELVKYSNDMQDAIVILRHLSRADNVKIKGVYRAMFPIPKEPTKKSSASRDI